jgi:hypothetical protein
MLLLLRRGMQALLQFGREPCRSRRALRINKFSGSCRALLLYPP